MRIEPVGSLRGDISVPGDKSISHRYGILGAIASGTTRIQGFSSSADCHSTLNCIRALGVSVDLVGNDVLIESRGWSRLREPVKPMDAGNSGSTIRMISALLAAQPFRTVIAGDESLNRRPMARIVSPLNLMGAEIEAQEGNFPPLRIRGGSLKGIRYELPVASAQVKSCVLLAGLMAKGITTVIPGPQTRDHTERALEVFGIPLHQSDDTLEIEGPAFPSGVDVTVVGDISSAIFCIVGTLLRPGSKVVIRNVGVNPTRTGLLELLEKSVSTITRTNPRKVSGEPACDLVVEFDPTLFKRFPTMIRGELIPNLIDEIPVLAILGTQIEQGLTIRDAAELRKKESDRIEAVVSNLQAVGISAVEYPDGFHIAGHQKIRGGRIRSYGDHRIAMAFAIAGLVSEEGIEIDDPQCAAVSFPNFYQVLDDLAGRHSSSRTPLDGS